MIIICQDWEEYESVKKDLYELTDKIDILAVKNNDAFLYYSVGDNAPKQTCSFSLLKTKLKIAHLFCTLQTLSDTIRIWFESSINPDVKLSVQDLSKGLDCPTESSIMED